VRIYKAEEDRCPHGHCETCEVGRIKLLGK